MASHCYLSEGSRKIKMHALCLPLPPQLSAAQSVKVISD